MALIYPSFTEIAKMNPQPTEGEEKLLNFLSENLDDSYEIYFQPSLNGDKPDIVIMRRGSGAMIIEVKDWDLNSYYCDSNGNFVLNKNNKAVKSPFDQVKQYKNNLYNLHSEVLLRKSIFDSSVYGIVKCGVYFHNAAESEIISFINNSSNNIKDKIFYNYTIMGYDSLNEYNLSNILYKNYLSRPSRKFDDEIYSNLKRNFQPSIQEYECLEPIEFSREQEKLAVSKAGEYKIKGVAGSGKTLVLAQRAVNSYIRTSGKVLILTYNITLKNYIHDKISAVRGKFKWSNFDINNYHKFIVFQMNNLGIPFERGEIIDDQASEELDRRYFSNQELFEDYKYETEKYDAVFIDEVQDYKYEWLNIIKKYFLKKNGEYVLFGDEKQNIYDRELEKDKTMKVNVPRRWSNLNKSYRLSTTMAQLAADFQIQYLSSKYSIDTFDLQTSVMDKLDVLQCINYTNFNAVDICQNIYEMLREHSIHSNDVCLLAPSISYLRELEYVVRNMTKEKSEIMFESKEEYERIQDMLWAKHMIGSSCYDKESYAKYQKELKAKLNSVRQGRKYNFYMNRGMIKLSSIHSFKGWEINTLVLIIDNTENTTDELVYTGLTRCRNNIILINIGNKNYNEFFNSRMPSKRGVDSVEEIELVEIEDF